MRVRSRRPAVLFACVAVILFCAAALNFELRGLARHPQDIQLFNLNRLRGTYERILLSDSVTENATNRIILDSRDYPLMTNGWLRLAGQVFLLRRALERIHPREIDLFLTPDLLLASVNDEGNGRIRYTYTDTLFRRTDEINDLRAAGDAEAGHRWVLPELLLKSFQPQLRQLSVRNEYQSAKPQPLDNEPLSTESQARLQARAAAFKQFRIPPQNIFFLRRFSEACSAANARCRFIVEPLPASLPRIDLKTELNQLAPGVEIADVNDIVQFPDAAFRDGLHLRDPYWTAFYRTILAERDLMRFEFAHVHAQGMARRAFTHEPG